MMALSRGENLLISKQWCIHIHVLYAILNAYACRSHCSTAYSCICLCMCYTCHDVRG